MNSKLFILFALNLSSVFAQLAIGRGKLIAGNGLIGSRGIGLGAVGYGGYGGIGLGYGGLGVAKVAGPVAVGVGGLGLSGGLPYGYGLAGPGIGLYGTGISSVALANLGVGVQPYAGPVSAAIQTIRTQHVVDIPTPQDVIQPSTLVIEPNVMPVNIEFRSQSSPVNVNQVHIPGRPGIVERTNSEEEPDRLIHEVVKPVVQEVRETIVPFRRITQEILPVQEEVHSLVARGQNQKVIAAEAPVAVAPARVAVAAPVAVGVAGPVGVVNGGLINAGITRFGGGLVNGGLIGGGLVRTGLVGGGLVNGGLINGGYVNGGLVNGGLIGGGVVKALPGNLELIKARS